MVVAHTNFKIYDTIKMPLTKGIFFALILFCCSLDTYAQFFDSIKVAMHNKPSVDFRFDSRTSFITTHPAKISGVKIGLAFNKTVKLGVGYNWLNTSLFKHSFTTDQSGITRKVTYKLILNYISPYFEYTYFNARKFELSIPVMIGLGKTKYTPLEYWLNVKPINSAFLLLYEPTSIAVYKVFPWLGLGLGIGYRLVLIGNRTINDNMNSPIYVYKVKFYPSELLK